MWDPLGTMDLLHVVSVSFSLPNTDHPELQSTPQTSADPAHGE